jgi:hypothetical protein
MELVITTPFGCVSCLKSWQRIELREAVRSRMQSRTPAKQGEYDIDLAALAKSTLTIFIIDTGASVLLPIHELFLSCQDDDHARLSGTSREYKMP